MNKTMKTLLGVGAAVGLSAMGAHAADPIDLAATGTALVASVAAAGAAGVAVYAAIKAIQVIKKAFNAVVR